MQSLFIKIKRKKLVWKFTHNPSLSESDTLQEKESRSLGVPVGYGGWCFVEHHHSLQSLVVCQSLYEILYNMVIDSK